MDIPIPQHMVKRDDDYVSYTATDAGGKKTDVNNICYANHMATLTSHAFDLMPYRTYDNWKKWATDGESYLRFIDVMKEHLLIHPTVEAKVGEGGKLLMHIPIGMSIHRVYSAMCAYRWCESMSPFVFLTMKLYDERKELSFWQILHYVMSVQVTGIGHNWCNIGTTKDNYGGIYSNNGMGYNLGLSLAFPLFWYKTEEELLKDTGRTCNAIDKVANSIAPCKAPDGQKYGMAIPTLLVCGETKGKEFPNDVLNPIWTPLYKYASSMAVCEWDAAVVGKTLADMYADITKDYEPIKKLREEVIKNKNKFGGYGY